MRTNRRFLVNKRSILALLAVLALMAMLAAQAVWAQDEDVACTESSGVVKCTYAEKDTDPVATFTAVSPEDDPVEFSLKGEDGGDFTIDRRGVLRFKKSPDYENPASAKAEELSLAERNVYEVTVLASDVRPVGAEGATPVSEIDVTVTVTNVDEPATLTMDRVQPEVSRTLTAILTDPDGAPSGTVWVWSVSKVNRPQLANDTHWQPAAATTTNAATYTPEADDVGKKLRVKAEYSDPHGKEKAAYGLSDSTVRAVPDGVNNTAAFDEPDISKSIAENAAVGANVGDAVTATDADKADLLTYVLGGAQQSSFSINKATGQITVAGGLDHEQGGVDGVYTVTVTAYDPSNQQSSPATVTITVTDVNEAPTVTGEQNGTTDPAEPDVDIPEGIVGETFTNTFFRGDMELDGLMYNSTDVDVDDEDNADVVTLSLSGDDEDAFELGSADENGNQSLTFKGTPDFENPTDLNKDNVYKVTVEASDGSLTGTHAVTISVTNVEETGAVTLSSVQPATGIPLTAALSDPDGIKGSVAWQWARRETNRGNFENIDGATSATYTPRMDDDPSTDEDESDVGYYVRATATYNDKKSEEDEDSETEAKEGERTMSQISESAVRVTPDVNDAPEFETDTVDREVEETEGAGGNVDDPVKATDPDSDVLSYSLSGGADKDAFTIDQRTGQVKVGANTKLNFEARTTYTVEVKADDPFGLSDTITVTITVTDVDEAPVLTLRPDNTPPKFAAATYTREVAENTAAGRNIGDPVRATDYEGDALAYSLSGADAASLTIGGTSGQIRTKDALDYETKSSYTVTVTAADPAGLSDAATVTITVTDVDEDPVVSGNAAVDYAEDGDGMVATYAAADPENGDISWSLSGDDADDFEISGAGMLTFMSPPDYENPMDANTDNMYSVMVVASDGTNDGAMGVTVTVTDVDENVAPEFAEDTTTREVEENTPQGENIGGPVAAMAGDDDTLTYAIGGADASSFIIIRTTGQIKVRDALDYERKNSYTVTVTATDESDLSDTITVTIMVTDKVGLENAYDVNDDGVIDRSEALNAVDDYFAPGSTLTKAEVLEVIALYLGL